MSNIPEAVGQNYRRMMQRQINPAGNIYVDDSDIVKPFGHAFEDLGYVRDGSSPDKKIEKGYHVAEICALLDKVERHKVSVPIDYLGFAIPDVFVVGYGLDIDEKGRNLPYIASVDPKKYEKSKHK